MNLHEGDLVAYNTQTDSICTLVDLHASRQNFPTASLTASLFLMKTV